MNINLNVRLLSNIVKNDGGCWIWQRARDTAGYGRIKVGCVLESVHRVSYELFVGEIPEGLCVCHYCNNKLCVNPGHLYVATREENMSHAHFAELVTPKQTGYHKLSLDENLRDW